MTDVGAPPWWTIATTDCAPEIGRYNCTLVNGTRLNFQSTDFHALNLLPGCMEGYRRLVNRWIDNGGAKTYSKEPGAISLPDGSIPAAKVTPGDFLSSSGERVSSSGKAFMDYYNLKSAQQPSVKRQRTEENISMLREFKQYISEHRDVFFTLILVMIADAWFLNGALKSRLQRILEGVTGKLEEKLNTDINGDGKVGTGAEE